MGEIFGSIWWLLVALGLLVTFHEFGHFWVARKLGVRVLRFSVGFGKALWSRRAADQTEYVIAAIPLGGYVKMLDEREGEVPQNELGQAFNRKPVWTRIAIVAAGPVFNLVFAVLAFWLMFMVGIPESQAHHRFGQRDCRRSRNRTGRRDRRRGWSRYPHLVARHP